MKKRLFQSSSLYLLLLMVAFGWYGCKKDDNSPTVTAPVLGATTAATSITATSAASGGNVTSDGGSTILARGVCYDTAANPTFDNDHKFTSDGTGTGSFTSTLTDLLPGKKYYARAFATNAEGIGYGTEISFSTESGLPVLDATTAGTNITSNSATSGGNVLSEGIGGITARGVCWSTSPNPTISGSKTSNGVGLGSFVSNITDLLDNTIYYVRTYATNAVGTAYGVQTSFTTLEAVTVTDIDGNVYPIVKIGTQRWMKENLKTTRYRDGSAIPNGLSGSAWSAATYGAYAVYMDSAALNDIYGKLYNWYAVTDSRNLCPNGWHVPTADEWTSLSSYLGGELVAGGKMKATTGWNPPNTGATNSSGFSGLPGGLKFPPDGACISLGLWGIWWSSSNTIPTAAPAAEIYSSQARLFLLPDFTKTDGLSVRCIRD